MGNKRGFVRKLSYLLVKSRRIAKRDGIPALFLRSVRNLRELAFRTTSSIWFERLLDAPVDPVLPKVDTTVTFLVEDKTRLIDWLREQRARFPWIYLQKEIIAAEAEKHIFVTILHNDLIIGYIKIGVAATYIHDFDRVIQLPPDVAIIYDTLVLPEYRGKNVAQYALSKTIALLRVMHFKMLWCHIEKWNKASLSMVRKTGFRERGIIRFCRVFGVPLFIRDGYVPLLHLKTFLLAER